MERELGVAPSPATREMYERLLAAEAPAAPVAEVPAQRATNNLPLQLTSFIGREREMAEINRLLSSSRLLTLTGPGGSGKTRLALQITAHLLAVREFPDGVWWVDLAPLSDPTLVPHALTSALNVREIPGRTLTETLVDYLHPRHLLLALDPTSVQSGEGPPSLDQLRQYKAIALFVERATAVLPTFRSTRQNMAAITLVCQRLDGIPLAIELAAARVKVLAVEQIAARLDNRFSLLTGSSRTALPRHRTLRATIDWSYDLLSEPERALFRRLSVFAGGFSLEAAEAVCGDEEDEWDAVLELLSHLVDKSLVTVEEHGEHVRYRLLETIRQYAREKLRGSDELARIWDRHLDFFLQFVEAAEPQLFGAGQVVWLNRLELDYDNLRAAAEWAGKVGAAVATLRLAGALRRFWYVRGQHGEGLTWLTEALTRPEAAERTAVRSKALMTAGHLPLLQGHYADAGPLLDEALGIGREVGHQWAIAMALHISGQLAISQGDYATARACFEEDVAIWQSLRGTPESATSFMHFGSLMYLGDVMIYQGDYGRGESLYEESAALLRALGDKNLLAYPLRRLGQVALHQGNYQQALARCQESLALNLEVGDRRGMVACLAGLAAVSAARGESVRAVQLCGAVAALLESLHTQLLALDADLYERNVTDVRAQLDEATFAAAWTAGRAMTLEQAIEHASDV